MIALIAVDMQNDFGPGGSLEVPGMDEVAESLNARMRRHERYVVASKDMHVDPGAHFVEYVPHCVKGTTGADFYHRFFSNGVDLIVEKGERAAAPSAFDGFTKDGRTLHQALQDKGITEIEVGGVAADVCVLTSCLDGIKLGYHVTLLTGATSAINGSEGMAKAVMEVLMAGGHLK